MKIQYQSGFLFVPRTVGVQRSKGFSQRSGLNTLFPLNISQMREHVIYRGGLTGMARTLKKRNMTRESLAMSVFTCARTFPRGPCIIYNDNFIVYSMKL